MGDRYRVVNLYDRDYLVDENQIVVLQADRYPSIEDLKGIAERYNELDTLRRRRELVVKRQMKKRGPRTKEWDSVWRFLKPELERRGRTRCEFHFIDHECWGRLDPCHSKKRRKMEGVDIYKVAIGCQQVHQYLDERCTHEQMEAFVEEAISLAGGLILPEKKAA